MMERIRFNRIKSALDDNGLPAWMLAPFLGVSLTTVYNWNRNKGQPKKDQFAKIAGLLRISQRKLVVSTTSPGHVKLVEAMKMATAQFESKYGSAYVEKKSINDKESKILNPKLKMLLRGIVEQYEKDGTLPK